MRVLFLHTRPSGYFSYAVNYLAQQTSADVHVVIHSPSMETPYVASNNSSVTQHDRATLSPRAIRELAAELRPRIAVVSGWGDSAYVAAARVLRRMGIPTVCCFDTPWRGTIRQQIATTLGRTRLATAFSHAWVFGRPQYEYARRLGFAPARIRAGLYSANVKAFEGCYAARMAKGSYPKRLLYVGRLSPEKGIRELLEAFGAISENDRQGWTLRVLGAGALLPTLGSVPGCEFAGFVDPGELPAEATVAGALVVPSISENWGLVLQEFAAAGLPLVCSSICGATTEYLISGYNGLAYDYRSVKALEDALRRLFSFSGDELATMGAHSRGLACRNSPDRWLATLLEIANSKPTAPAPWAVAEAD
jgi:glycosyltransferase involved in cell wall biosynthesis